MLLCYLTSILVTVGIIVCPLNYFDLLNKNILTAEIHQSINGLEKCHQFPCFLITQKLN